MAGESIVSDSVDPLSGLNGPSLFPRTIRASIDGPVPVDSKDLDSIHNFMKSLELRSPEKLMNEAKRIVDGGAALRDSNLASFAENVGINDAITTKGKARPQERRQGLGLTRKRAPFSLKTNVSQASVSLEPTLNIDQLQDPDEFFDAYERLENAKKELQRQLGGRMDNVNEYKPSTDARLRRPGILGKSYNYKHRYSSVPFENDVLMSSQEAVERDIPSAPRDNTLEKLIDPDPYQDIDLEEFELAASMKIESELNNILDELMSCNDEDLEGDGALNLLQERLKIKPLDLENISLPEHRDVQRTNILTIGESVRKDRKTSLIIDNVLKNLNGKQPIDHDQMAQNPGTSAASPTPPRSPFASLSLLKKRILQSNPPRDPFSPLNVDLSACRTASPVQPIDKPNEQVNAPTDSSISRKLKSQAEVEITEPTNYNMDIQKAIGSTDSLPDQFVDENASIQTAKADSRPNKERDYNIEETTNIENLHDNQSNPSLLEDEAMDAPSRRQQFEAEKQPEVHQTKLPRRKREAGDERLKKAHPLRKSFAESGTSFETGVRRSKRIKMRPLEYWKGERFLYGRVDDSLKLIGVKYISPGKSDTNLKVKPYILSESSKYKELLELAALH